MSQVSQIHFQVEKGVKTVIWKKNSGPLTSHRVSRVELAWNHTMDFHR